MAAARLLSRRGLSAARRPLGDATLAVHGDRPSVEGYSTAHDVAPPLSVSTTFHAGGTHIYGRLSNPGVTRAEAMLGGLEAGPSGAAAHAVLYPSGLAATFGALAHLAPRRILIRGGYHGTHQTIELLQRLGGASGAEVADLDAPVRPGDLVWLETPRNPDVALADIGAYVEAGRAAGGGVDVVVDGTFAPPPLQRPLLLGATAVVHSTTKSMAGHSDANGGAVVVPCAAAAEALRGDRAAVGAVPGALEAWLLVRSLKTLPLRAARQSASAAAVAAFLDEAASASSGGDADHPLAGLVHGVHYPGIGPDAALAARQMPGGAGGTLAVLLASEAAAQALPGALELFADATSLGGVDSKAEWRKQYDDQVDGRLVRLSIGLEEPEDLIADLTETVLRLGA